MTAKPRPFVHFISQTETILQAVSYIPTNYGAKIFEQSSTFILIDCFTVHYCEQLPLT